MIWVRFQAFSPKDCFLFSLFFALKLTSPTKRTPDYSTTLSIRIFSIPANSSAKLASVFHHKLFP